MSYHGLTLTTPIARLLSAGRTDLPLEDVPGADRCEAGQPVRLLSPAGELVALAVADPENGLVRVMSLAQESRLTLDARWLRERLQGALRLRAAFGLKREDTVHRLVHSAGDGLSGLTLDLYGEFGVLCAYSRGLIPWARQLAALAREELGLAGVVIKQRTRDVGQGAAIKQEVCGVTPPERYVVTEGGVPFEVHLMAGLNVGLFGDMREHRAQLGRFAAGRRVLNTFSYTGSLSVVAARAGASQVVSVDMASGVHSWARANFELSALSPADHRFETQEISGYLKKAARAGERFDLAIVDPPTYSAARASAWSMRKDYPALIERVLAVLGPGAILWLSANSRELGPLTEVAQGALESAARSGQVLSLGGLPCDYPTLLSQPEDRYLQVCLLQVS